MCDGGSSPDCHEQGNLHGSLPGLFVCLGSRQASAWKAGNVVIVGRGGNFLTADIPLSLHVRLVGSVSCRISHFAKRSGWDHADAAAEVARIDRARKRYIKTRFRKDIDDPTGYDLVLNTDGFDNEQAVSVILAAMHQKTV